MDDTTHAHVMKQCFHCHHWALLTHANWPKSSREDPNMSCCRKCRADKGMPVEEGDSDEEGIDIDFEHLRLHHSDEGDICQGSTKVAIADSFSHDTTANSGKTGKMLSDDSSRSIMASRWAFIDDNKKVFSNRDKGKSYTSAASAQKPWLKKREDLFNGEANVSNAGLDIFATSTNKRGGKKSISIKEEKSKRGNTANGEKREIPPASDIIKMDGLMNTSRAKTQPTPLTGANSSAVGSDNGWKRLSKSAQLDSYTLNADNHRDMPPHLETTTSRLEARDYKQQGLDILKGVDEDQVENHNAKLLKAIAKMEQRNISMLHRPALTSMSSNRPLWQ